MSSLIRDCVSPARRLLIVFWSELDGMVLFILCNDIDNVDVLVSMDV